MNRPNNERPLHPGPTCCEIWQQIEDAYGRRQVLEAVVSARLERNRSCKVAQRCLRRMRFDGQEV